MAENLISASGSTFAPDEEAHTSFAMETKPFSGQDKQQHNSSAQVTEEGPKAPISDSRWVALKRCLPVLAPIPITVTLVILHFKHVVYISQDGLVVSQIQDALLFAAGLYGTLIVASVSAIALHRIQWELAEREGVALGYLLAGYQLNHLKTLLSKEFWTGTWARNCGGSRLQHISLVALVGLCMFLAHFGQSFGSILLVPKQAWWSVDWKPVSEFDAYITNSTELYPQRLTQAFLPDGTCLSSNALQNESCPAGGNSTIVETFSNWNAYFLQDFNLSFFNDEVGREVVSEYVDSYILNFIPLKLNVTSSDSSITSSLQQVFARSIANYFQWGHNWKLTLTGVNKDKLFMPLVQVQCVAMPPFSSTVKFPFSNLLYSPLHLLPNTTNWTLPMSEFPQDNGMPIQFSWADLSSFNPGPSLGAVDRLSQDNLTNTTIPDGSISTPLTNPTILACTVDARWAPVKLYYQPMVDETVHPENPFPNLPNMPQIQIDPSWAEALNLPVPGSSLTAMESLIQFVVSEDLGIDNSTYFLPDLAIALGTTITDGLARIGWQDQFAYTTPNKGSNTFNLTRVSNSGTKLNSLLFSEDQAANWTQLEWQVEHYGYGYSASTITAKLAMAMLLLHALLALGHTIVVYRPWKGRVWTCDAWGSIAGLVVLAMNSRPDERLLNMSAGIKLKKSWKEVLKIREVGQEEVELLVAEETPVGERWMGKEGEKLQANKIYGTD